MVKVMHSSLLSRFVKGVVSTGIGLLVSILFGFVNIMVVARFISKEQFGVFILLQVFIVFFIVVGDAGLNIATVRYIASNDEVDKKAKIINTLLFSKSVISLLLVILIVLFKNLLSFFFKSRVFDDIFFWIPILFLCENFYALFNSLLQGLHLFRKLAISQVVLSGLYLLVTILYLVVF